MRRRRKMILQRMRRTGSASFLSSPLPCPSPRWAYDYCPVLMVVLVVVGPEVALVAVGIVGAVARAVVVVGVGRFLRRFRSTSQLTELTHYRRSSSLHRSSASPSPIQTQYCLAR